MNHCNIIKQIEKWSSKIRAIDLDTYPIYPNRLYLWNTIQDTTDKLILRTQLFSSRVASDSTGDFEQDYEQIVCDFIDLRRFIWINQIPITFPIIQLNHSNSA